MLFLSTVCIGCGCVHYVHDGLCINAFFLACKSAESRNIAFVYYYMLKLVVHHISTEGRPMPGLLSCEIHLFVLLSKRNLENRELQYRTGAF